MRTWRRPSWLEAQKEIALKRGWAWVRQYHSREGNFCKITFKDPHKIVDYKSKHNIVEFEIEDGDGKRHRYLFDAQELLYWLRYV